MRATNYHTQMNVYCWWRSRVRSKAICSGEIRKAQARYSGLTQSKDYREKETLDLLARGRPSVAAVGGQLHARVFRGSSLSDRCHLHTLNLSYRCLIVSVQSPVKLSQCHRNKDILALPLGRRTSLHLEFFQTSLASGWRCTVNLWPRGRRFKSWHDS